MKNNKALIILLLSAALWILMLFSAAPKLITHAAGDMPTEEEIAEEEYWDNLELLAIRPPSQPRTNPDHEIAG